MSSIEPTTYNHVLRRFRSYEKTFEFLDSANVAIDLSAYTVTAEIRKDMDYESDLVGTFTVDVSDAANGNITLSLTAAEVGALTSTGGYWDLLFEATGVAESWLEGRVDIKETVTNVS